MPNFSDVISKPNQNVFVVCRNYRDACSRANLFRDEFEDLILNANINVVTLHNQTKVRFTTDHPGNSSLEVQMRGLSGVHIF